MLTSQDLLAQNLEHVVPFSFNAGFLVLSYAVSLIGAGSTLELINRRTSRKGVYNQYLPYASALQNSANCGNSLLLFGAAISMGGVAIWSMVS